MSAEKPVHVYAATCGINGKVYVGITTELGRRKGQHKSSALTGEDTLFYRAIRKHGRESFKWELLETCPTREVANERERLWITRFNSMTPAGYNSAEGGVGSPGMKHTDEARKKMSNAKKGKPGLPVGDETRKKISAAHRGQTRQPLSDEHRTKISNALKGRTLSEGHKKKLSELQKSIFHPPLTEEHKKKISESLMGNVRGHLSEEHKKKISDSLKMNRERKAMEQVELNG